MDAEHFNNLRHEYEEPTPGLAFVIYPDLPPQEVENWQTQKYTVLALSRPVYERSAGLLKSVGWDDVAGLNDDATRADN